MPTIDYNLTSSYEGVSKGEFWFKPKFVDKNIIIGISDLRGDHYDTSRLNEEENEVIIDKVYKLYLEKWKNLFQENQLHIKDIVLNLAYTTSSFSTCGGSLHFKEKTPTSTPANVKINYVDLTITSMVKNIDFLLFPVRTHSKKYSSTNAFKEFDEYNYEDILSYPDYYAEFSITAHTINEIKQEIKQKLSKKYINSKRLDFQKHLDKYIAKVADKLTKKYSLDCKDATDFITRSNDDEWTFEYKTTKHDKLTDKEYWQIIEDVGYNQDLAEDSLEGNISMRGTPATIYMMNREIKQLVGISRK